MNNENRLQFLHCNQLFRSVDEIKNYVGTQDKFGDVPALFAEPTVFKYSDGVTTSDDNPNLVLAIGSNGDGTKNSTNNTFFIDITTVENKIASLSSFTNSESAELHDLEQLVKIVREDSIINLATSNSVEFVEISNNESGKTYTANVKICKQSDNIIEINHKDGIYAKADLTYDQSSNTLSFTNSKGTTTIPLTQNQFFVSGYYSNQSDEIVLEFTGTTGYNEIRIPVKGLIEEWTVDNTGHNVRLVKVVNTGTVDNKLSADVNIAQVDHNILKSTIDGAGLYVNGSADNLYYDITHSTIKDKIESVINDNSLESARAQAEEIALSGAIHSETDRAVSAENLITNEVARNYNSALTKTQIEIDNRIAEVNRVETLLSNSITAETEQRKSAILTEVADRNAAILASENRSSNLVSIEANRAETAENAISASTLNSINNTNTKIDNVNSSLTKSINSEIDRAKTAENAITNQVTNNYNSALTKTQIETDNRILDVKRVEDLALNAISVETEQRKAVILTEVSDRNTAISESESRSAALVSIEANRAKDVENLLSASTLNIINSVNNVNSDLDDVNSSLTLSINTERLRATASEQTLADDIKGNKITVFDSKTINFTSTITDNGTSLSGDVNIADIPSSNILRIGESGLYASPANLTYDPLTNLLTFIDENGKEIKWTLAGTQVISSSTYIESSRVLRLIFGNGSAVDIPLNGLVEEWIASDTDTIDLEKAYDAVQGKDILKATAKLSDNSSNALTTSGNGLYVNNAASNYIYQDGSTNGISVQSAITLLNTGLDITNDTINIEADKLVELSGKTITALTKTDSDTIAITITGDSHAKNISAAAKIAQGETNAVKNENGLYVSNRADKLFISDGTSTIQNKLNNIDNTILTVSAITNNLSDEISNETALRKAIEGQSGNTYTHNINSNFISGATNLNEADVMLNDAIMHQSLKDGRFISVSADNLDNKTINLNLPINSGSTSFSANSLTFNDLTGNTTTSRFSTSFGRSTSTKNISEIAVGECNISVKDNSAPSAQTMFTVGIGTVTETVVEGVIQETKSYANGLEVRKDGNIYIKLHPNDPSTELNSLQEELEIIDCGEF